MVLSKRGDRLQNRSIEMVEMVYFFQMREEFLAPSNFLGRAVRGKKNSIRDSNFYRSHRRKRGDLHVGRKMT
jgi:hypothetical protein